VAAVGNPRSGVWVYNSYDNPYGAWNIFGGTSVASPLWAGIVNHAGHFSATTLAEQTLIYANAKTAANFRDVSLRHLRLLRRLVGGRGLGSLLRQWRAVRHHREVTPQSSI
jgi:hypothetical protein